MIDPGPIMVLLSRMQEQILRLEAALADRDRRITELEQANGTPRREPAIR